MLENNGRFKKGHIPWHKGKKTPQLSGKNNSNWKGGEVWKNCAYCRKEYHCRPVRADKSKCCSISCHNKLMPTYRNVWNKGTAKISTENELVRKSSKYKKWRKSVFERDKYLCVIGLEKHGRRLNADHIKPFAFFPELRFELSNGRTLCVECHRKTDTYGWNIIHKKQYEKT